MSGGRTVFSFCAVFFPLVAGWTSVQSGTIGDPNAGNGWNASDVVVVRSSSQHDSMNDANLVNGSGVDETGQLHRNTGLYASRTLAESKTNARGGTVEGGHWVEFAFDRVYALKSMAVWNYNGRDVEYDWRTLGFREVTIQYSENGGDSPSDWTTIFQGEIPMAESPAPEFLAPVSLEVDFAGAKAKYVVITTADGPGLNWMNGGEAEEHSDAGLSEVRFYFDN